MITFPGSLRRSLHHPIVAAHEGGRQGLFAANQTRWPEFAPLIEQHGVPFGAAELDHQIALQRAPVYQDRLSPSSEPIGRILTAEWRRDGLVGRAAAYTLNECGARIQHEDAEVAGRLLGGGYAELQPWARSNFKFVRVTYAVYDRGAVITNGALFDQYPTTRSEHDHTVAAWVGSGLGQFVEFPNQRTVISKEHGAIEQLEALGAWAQEWRQRGTWPAAD